MRILINGQVYDGKKDIIMVFLNDFDKQNIQNMPADLHIYCEYPGPEEIKEQMDDFKEFNKQEDDPDVNDDKKEKA